MYAYDRGPESVLMALCDDNVFSRLSSPDLCRLNLDSVLVGTSQSDKGIEIESDLRQQAKQLKLPLIVIEDFPGNFRPVYNGSPDLILFEHDLISNLSRHKIDVNSTKIVVCSNPRYDNFRKTENIRSNLNKIWLAGTSFPAVLWAGQPETELAGITLREIVPKLKEMNFKLLFKAHPDDAGYHDGYYAIFHEIMGHLWEDTTAIDFKECILKYAPRVVLTHYSSLGIEAGFYGIPTMNILADHSVTTRFKAQTGFNLPPWCEPDSVQIVLNYCEFSSKITLLANDDACRHESEKIFLDWFGSKVSSDQVKNVIKTFLNNYSTDIC